MSEFSSLRRYCISSALVVLMVCQQCGNTDGKLKFKQQEHGHTCAVGHEFEVFLFPSKGAPQVPSLDQGRGLPWPGPVLLG